MTGLPEQLLDLVRDRRVVPFVGAGFSFVAGFPGWIELLRHVCADVAPTDDFDAVVKSCSNDPLRIAEYLLVRSGGNIGPIRHQMSSALRTPASFFSSAHVDLANLHLPVIYTTNFDELIEETYRRLGLSVNTICNARDLALARRDTVEVVKFHGDLRYDDTLVLTESSFHSRLDLESPLDLKFRGDILGRSLLFIGYGFGDINVRAIWFKLMKLMRDVPLDERPASFIIRLRVDPVLEALDRAVGLTTVTLDPSGAARTPADRQRLLERFMLELTFAAPSGPTPAEPLPMFASPGLVREATELVSANPRRLEPDDERVLDALKRRELHDDVREDMDGLMTTFADRRPRGSLADFRRAIALNYAMNYGDRFALSRSSHGRV
jgi:hypothetical protein